MEEGISHGPFLSISATSIAVVTCKSELCSKFELYGADQSGCDVRLPDISQPALMSAVLSFPTANTSVTTEICKIYNCNRELQPVEPSGLPPLEVISATSALKS